MHLQFQWVAWLRFCLCSFDVLLLFLRIRFVDLEVLKRNQGLLLCVCRLQSQVCDLPHSWWRQPCDHDVLTLCHSVLAKQQLASGQRWLCALCHHGGLFAVSMRGALSKKSDGDDYKRCSLVCTRHCLSASADMEDVPAKEKTEDLPVRRKGRPQK